MRNRNTMLAHRIGSITQKWCIAAEISRPQWVRSFPPELAPRWDHEQHQDHEY